MKVVIPARTTLATFIRSKEMFNSPPTLHDVRGNMTDLKAAGHSVVQQHLAGNPISHKI